MDSTPVRRPRAPPPAGADVLGRQDRLTALPIHSRGDVLDPLEAPSAVGPVLAGQLAGLRIQVDAERRATRGHLDPALVAVAELHLRDVDQEQPSGLRAGVHRHRMPLAARRPPHDGQVQLGLLFDRRSRSSAGPAAQLPASMLTSPAAAVRVSRASVRRVPSTKATRRGGPRRSAGAPRTPRRPSTSSHSTACEESSDAWNWFREPSGRRTMSWGLPRVPGRLSTIARCRDGGTTGAGGSHRVGRAPRASASAVRR